MGTLTHKQFYSIYNRQITDTTTMAGLLIIGGPPDNVELKREWMNNVTELKSKYKNALNIYCMYTPSFEQWHEFDSDINVAVTESIKKEITFVYLNVILGSSTFSAVIEQLPQMLPNMGHLHLNSAGINHVSKFKSINDAEMNGLKITNAKGCFSVPLAEWVLFACAYFAKHQYRLLTQKKSKEYKQFVVRQLKGLTIAILGYGDIGREIGRLAKEGYGMKVVGIKRVMPVPNDIHADEIQQCSKEVLKHAFSTYDFVVSVLPLTIETDQIIDADVINSSHKNLIFVNIGRGQNVDEGALIKALTAGILQAAALDVFENEPIPQSSPIWTLPNDKILISPHSCDYTEDLPLRAVRRMKAILEDVMEGRFSDDNTVSCANGY